MKIKRILIVTTTYIGMEGISSVIMNYYRNIDRKKVQFDFAIGEGIDKTIKLEIENLGGKVYILPSRKKKTLKYIKELKKIAKNKYEIAHVHGNSGTMYLDIHALKSAGVKTRIAHSHNSTCSHKFMHKLLKAHLNKEVTHGIACSKLAGDWIFDNSYTVINNGIDISKFSFNKDIRESYKKELNLENKFVIGHVGRFSYQKNHEFLLDIFKGVHDKQKDSILVLVGDGELRNEIEAKIDKLGLKDSVILLGKRKDVSEIMQMMDVFVMPSRHEGLPVVLVEAQASGLKAFVADTITTECKVTDNINFFSLDNIQIWIDSILESNKEYIRDYADEIMNNSKFNIKNEAKKLEEIYLR
ncbi:glycosyltransferase family 1 protein [uncultured Clostridium sp.]|uniref:glycosyltransferase family 1 protein n=1 Tax=uncultured Clostridium sp. TaxID=59620 RepID=UPI002599BFB2|nr:glycosyltransferase family 1 protein [uncultured Clostridium sp.]